MGFTECSGALGEVNLHNGDVYEKSASTASCHLYSSLAPGYHSTNFCSLKWFSFGATEFLKSSLSELQAMTALLDAKQVKVPASRQEDCLGSGFPRFYPYGYGTTPSSWKRDRMSSASLLILLDGKLGDKKSAKIGPVLIGPNNSRTWSLRGTVLPLRCFAFNREHMKRGFKEKLEVASQPL